MFKVDFFKVVKKEVWQTFLAKQKSPPYLWKNLWSTEINQDTLFFFYASVFLPLFFFSLFFSLPICLLQLPLLRLQENSPLYSQRFLSLPFCARNGERSKKGPGRNGGALCPEFVPHRSPFSFTRDDKSGVALTLYPSSHPPRPFPYRPVVSILAYTQNYRDRT